jgi:hypothetical protein
MVNHSSTILVESKALWHWRLKAIASAKVGGINPFEVDLLLAKGANRTTRVNNMNFAEYAQRYGASVELIGGTFSELEKRSIFLSLFPLTITKKYEN